MNQKLIQKAIEMRKFSYAPFSKYKVGSSIETKNGNIIIRDYNMDDLVKQSLEMLEKYKADPDDYDDPAEYEADLQDDIQSINEIKALLHLESSYNNNKENELEIILKVPGGPGGLTLELPFHLSREKNE